MGFGGLLKQSTAVDVLIGPFIDDTDGKTAEGALTLSQADIKLSKNGQALAQKNDATAASADADGYYNCELDATDTNTIGQLTLIVHESGALAVRQDYQVVEEEVYVDLFASGGVGYLKPTTAGRDLDVTVNGEVGLDFGNTTGTIDAAQLGADCITAAKIADDAIAAEHLAAGAIINATFAADVQSTAYGSNIIAQAVGKTIVNYNLDHLVIATGVVETDGGNSTTQVKTDLAETTNDHYDVMTILFTSGAEAGQSRLITGYTGASGTVSWNAALTGTPADDSTFIILSAGTTADAVWDEILTGSSHNITNSAGKRLRQIEQAFIHASGIVSGVTDGHTFTLDAGAVAATDYYIGDRLNITEGTGSGQSRLIVGYTSGKVVTLDSDFITNPDTSSLYEVDAADVHVSLSDADQAQGFVATYTNTTTITLDAAAIGTTDYYKDSLIVFTHGSGAGQTRRITGYTNSRVVTMSPALVTGLGTTTVWHIQAAASATEVVDEWETQSQSDPTGFHVNVKEVNGTAQTANDNGADINTLITNVDSLVSGVTIDDFSSQAKGILGGVTLAGVSKAVQVTGSVDSVVSGVTINDFSSSAKETLGGVTMAGVSKTYDIISFTGSVGSITSGVTINDFSSQAKETLAGVTIAGVSKVVQVTGSVDSVVGTVDSVVSGVTINDFSSQAKSTLGGVTLAGVSNTFIVISSVNSVVSGVTINDFSSQAKSALGGVTLAGVSRTYSLENFSDTIKDGWSGVSIAGVSKVYDIISNFSGSVGSITSGVTINDFSSQAKETLAGVTIAGVSKTYALISDFTGSVASVTSGVTINDFSSQAKGVLGGVTIAGVSKAYDLLAISGSVDAADKLEASAETIQTGAAEAGTLSTTQMTTNLTEATDDHYNGRIVIWTSGVLLRQATDITDYSGATGLLTFTAVTEAPSAADTFVIV
ncbi:MAG: hypothetical protein FVQ80_07045 [Planctomycetes bacterium]|nr:hypothetical protein [Planctomycetota bacterium]